MDRTEEAQLHFGLTMPVGLAGAGVSLSAEPGCQVVRDLGEGRDERDRCLGLEQLAGFAPDPERGLAFVGLGLGPREDLRGESLQRAVPSDRDRNDVRLVRYGGEVVAAQVLLVGMRWST
jgi:hypothetical protein